MSIWTLSISEIGPDGSAIAESGPRYQLFVGPVADITSEFVAEPEAGKPVAFRLDPAFEREASYFVSLDDDRLRIQPR